LKNQITREDLLKQIDEMTEYAPVEFTDSSIIKIDLEKLKCKEIEVQLSIINDAYFEVWKKTEKSRERKKHWLFYASGILAIVQVVFIFVVVLLNASCNSFYINDNVLISVVFASFAQVVGIVAIITKNLFDNKNDKFFAFITGWINKTK